MLPLVSAAVICPTNVAHQMLVAGGLAEGRDFICYEDLIDPKAPLGAANPLGLHLHGSGFVETLALALGCWPS